MKRWLAAFAIGAVIIPLAAASFAQFQVNQRRGWTVHDWALASRASMAAQLQIGLDQETAANPTIEGQLFHVISPKLGLDQTFAAGEGLLPNDDVRVASNIKPFVAAAALILVERGQLNLDAPVAPYLSAPVRKILADGGRLIDEMSLRQLLNHSSGLGDYGSSKLFQALAYVPTAFGLAWHWKAPDQIWFAANFAPKIAVGARFDYSDTNYLLVSDMIAKATDMPNAGIALRDLLNWSQLGADETYWENYEPTPDGTRLVRHFRGAIEDTHLDVSFDQYGGGGLVMSMDDLARAHRAIVRGEVFTAPSPTRTLMQTPGTAFGTNGYALGLVPMIIEGETCWGHGGRWGTMALHCPRLDFTIARSWGQSNSGPDVFDPKGPIVRLIRLAQQSTR